jgi:hypothetical protein
LGIFSQVAADEQNRLANVYANPVHDLYMREAEPPEETANEESVERLNLEIRRSRKDPSTHARDAYLLAHPDPGPIALPVFEPTPEDVFKAQRPHD